MAAATRIGQAEQKDYAKVQRLIANDRKVRRRRKLGRDAA